MPKTSSTVDVRGAGPGEIGQVVAVLGRAFATGALAEWLVPASVPGREALFGRYAQMLAGFMPGEVMVEVSGDYAGAAVWYPAPGCPAVPGPQFARAVTDAVGCYADRFVALEAALALHHPLDVAHHHLSFVGICPAQWRTGIGSALLAHHTALLDRDGIPAAAIATSPASRDLCRAHNFTVVEEFEVGGGLPLWALTRPSRPPPHQHSHDRERTPNARVDTSGHDTDGGRVARRADAAHRRMQ
jgi:GNAT superfamily N-acetyltransferase